MVKTAGEMPTELEQVIVRQWERIFNIECVSSKDNFFELGGDSLIAMKLMDQISAILDIEIPVYALFQNPTPKMLAVFISEPDSAT